MQATPTPQPLSHIKNDDFPLPLGEDARRAGEGAFITPTPQPFSHIKNDDFPLLLGEDARRAGEGECHYAKLTSLQIRCYARELRKNMTKAECLLWQYLRKRRLCAHKFRRQHALGYYILDFYCHELKLVIELDGNQHLEENQREYDMQRSVVLANLGISVLRFRNYQVLNNIEAVLKIIESYISKAMPTPQPLSQRERA
jgi:very-short-patch-repair endonuclease